MNYTIREPKDSDEIYYFDFLVVDNKYNVLAGFDYREDAELFIAVLEESE